MFLYVKKNFKSLEKYIINVFEYNYSNGTIRNTQII